MDLDFELKDSSQELIESLNVRRKTSLRMKYEAELKVFLERQGGLENIRKALGFSQRKMCQLLMVDPSAWSRWIKDESKLPPHIGRSLEWLLQLEGKNPEVLRVLTAGLMSSGRSNPEDTKARENLSAKIQLLEQEVEALKTRRLVEISKFMMLLIGLFALALLLVLVK